MPEDITTNNDPSGTKTAICPGASPENSILASTDNKNDIGSGYVGGKGGSGVYQTIINLIPPHNVYIETHLGGASIMKHKKPAAYNIGIDLDPEVIKFWSSSPLFENDVIPRGIGSDINKINEWRQIRFSNSINDEAVPEFNFKYGDALLLLKDNIFGDEFVYCDPPYLMSTRKGGTRSLYKYEYTIQDHIDLLKFINNLPCMVMISGYYSDLYMEMLPGWNTISYEAQTRQGKATEWLWFNYPVPEKLHDYSYIGNTFRERERIKKKKNRWINRFKNLPALERNSMLYAFRELEE